MDFLKAVVLVIGMFVLAAGVMYFADHDMFVKTITGVKGIVDTTVDSFTKK